MYAKLCDIEILASYIKQISVGDMLTVQALITNPLDWQHFYEKLSIIKRGDKTEFIVVTQEGDRLVGLGDITEVEKWSNRGQYGFKIKIDIKKQKSLTDRRIRSPSKGNVPAPTEGAPAPERPAIEQQVPQLAAAATTTSTNAITPDDSMTFRELLKSSLTMDMAR